MKRPTLIRILLNLLQHVIAAVFAAVMLLFVFQHVIGAGNMSGGITWYIMNPIGDGSQFVESEIFPEMFRSATDDILRLVVIKSQLESDGAFDTSKEINVAAYANRKSGDSSDMRLTAIYQLGDLIKWGKSGLEMTTLRMTKEVFVTYFNPDIISWENFYLDDDNNPQFIGFDSISMRNQVLYDAEANGTTLSINEKFYINAEEFEFIANYYSYEALINIVYEYIIANMNKTVNQTQTETGEEIIALPILNCRYATVDGYDQLLDMADNWIDYGNLENYLTEAIENLSYNYSQYQNFNEIYSGSQTNLKYMVSIQTEYGWENYGNLTDEVMDYNVNSLTSYFTNLGEFLIYSPKEMDFQSNTAVSEDEVYGVLESYNYVYPDATRIWIGVDTAYPVQSDPFSTVDHIYTSLAENIILIITGLLLILALWLALWIYLTVTAGRAVDENGGRVWYLNGFDGIWTEVLIALTIVLGFLGYLGLAMVIQISTGNYNASYLADGIWRSSADWPSILLTCIYFFLGSLTFCLVWYSFIRRLKSRNFWKDSFLCLLSRKIFAGTRLVIDHPNAAIRTLIPYVLFLLINLFGAIIIFLFRYNSFFPLIVLLLIFIFDVIIGMIILRRSAERLDIMEGIDRIREGEVDYHLDISNLHGENRKNAEAVNNIGEGIRKAVETSMKDEKLKTDLITNVSHDIKTPLTSIINYVDLLKREKITQEPVKSYIEILDSKSQRLKQLTEDLVEASKISSGNIELNFELLNLTELINQSIGEFSEKFEEKKLIIILDNEDLMAYIYADSRRMWRIVENLFNNIYKYAMPGTRVYIDIKADAQIVEASIKNISLHQLNISPEELTERFIRGDSSRTTEGSGLGLSIAKSLSQAQGGEFQIYMDGDLFKVILRFPKFMDEIMEHDELEI